MFRGLLRLPASTRVLQSPCGPVIREGRVEVHRSGKAFKAPPGQDWPTAQRVNRPLKISQLLRENQGHPTCRAVRKESKVFVGSGEGSRLALSTAGKCVKQSSHGFCAVTAVQTVKEVSTTASGGKAPQLPGVSPFMCSPCGGSGQVSHIGLCYSRTKKNVMSAQC